MNSNSDHSATVAFRRNSKQGLSLLTAVGAFVAIFTASLCVQAKAGVQDIARGLNPIDSACQSKQTQTDEDVINQFALANCLIEQRDHRQAVEILKKIVATDDWPVYKAELGRAYLGMQEFELARQQFHAALKTNPPQEARDLLQMYLNMAETEQVQAKEWIATASVAYVHDSNVNSGPASAAVTMFGLPMTLGASSMPRSDSAMRSTLVGIHSHNIGAGIIWQTSINAESSNYLSAKEFNTAQVNVEAGPRLNGYGPLSLYTPAGLTQSWLGSSIHAKSTSFTPQLRYSSDEIGTGTLGVQAANTDHPGSPLMSSNTTSMLAAWRLPLTSHWTLEGGLQRAQESANDASFSNRRSTLSGSVKGTLANQFRFSAEASVTEAQYSAAEAWASEARKDVRKNFMTSLSKDLPGGYYISLSWLHAKVKSNLELYTTQRNQAQIQLSKAF